MHELGIMESTMELVEQHARAQGATRVHRITLRIGRLAGVEVQALRFAFDVVAARGPAAGAELEIVDVPARAHCAACREEFTVEQAVLIACPRCGAFSGDILQGREMELSSLELS